MRWFCEYKNDKGIEYCAEEFEESLDWYGSKTDDVEERSVFCPKHRNQLDKTSPARYSVNYNYNQLDWEFINAMARIGKYGADKYGEGSWKAKVKKLVGDKSGTNHIAEHLKAYLCSEGHDKFGDNKMNLAAIAYNAMMEYRRALEVEKDVA